MFLGKKLLLLGFFNIALISTLLCQILPNSLKYGGKPIDPYCIVQITQGDSSKLNPLSLEKCYQQIDEIVVHSKKAVPSKGKSWSAGYNYTYRRKENQEYFDRFGPEECYAHWRYLGSIDQNQHVIFVKSGCYSSTGRFSNIILLQRDKDALQNLGEIAGGDRANGSIDQVSYDENKLTYTQWFTPQQLFNLWRASRGIKVSELGFTQAQLRKFQSDLDKSLLLDDCAICGVAKVEFIIEKQNLKFAKYTKNRIRKIQLKNFSNGMGKDIPLKPITFKDCFSFVYKEYTDQEELILDENDLNTFFKKVIVLYKSSVN